MMFILASRLQPFRRMAVTFILLFCNIVLFISVAFLSNNGGQHLLSWNELSLNSIEKNSIVFIDHVRHATLGTKVWWSDFNISFQNSGLNLIQINLKLSLIVLIGSSILLGGTCVARLIKASYNFTNSGFFALIMILFGILMLIETVWLSTLLAAGGDWIRSFWGNVICLFLISQLNKYAKRIQGKYYPHYSYSIFRRFFRGLRFLLVPTLAIFVIGISIYFSATSITKDVTVKAKNGWVSTGLSLGGGEKAEITYLNGKWAVNEPTNGNYIYTNVNGFSTGFRTCDLDHQWSPLHNTKPGQLIARIGTNNTTIPIGNQTLIVAKNSGILYLRANDSDYCLNDNTGSIVIRVSVHRVDWKNMKDWSIINQILNDIKKWSQNIFLIIK